MSTSICRLGFRVKTGWAAVVLIGGSKKAPRLLDSRVLVLSDPAVGHSRQPYHAGFGTAQTNRGKVARLVRGIERYSRRAIAELLREYRKSYRVRRAGVVVASLTDPASIGNPHMRAHASEGQLFRRVLVEGLARCRVDGRVVLEREVYHSLAGALRCTLVAAKALVGALGESAKPWRAEQKAAAAAALLAG